MHFIVNLIEIEVSTGNVEVKEALDPDYKFLVGIAVPDGKFSAEAILESIKIKGREFLPPGLEMGALVSTKAVEPNKRFFTLFKPVEIKGDDLIIRVKEPSTTRTIFNVNIQVMLTNHPTDLLNVLNA